METVQAFDFILESPGSVLVKISILISKANELL
jgi:hypothetical protein